MPLVTDFDTARSELQRVFSRYNSIKNNARQHRVTYLQGLSDAIADSTTGNSDTIYQQLIVRERQKTYQGNLK
jgi:hypothetical protein